jgi:hypothetical protein
MKIRASITAVFLCCLFVSAWSTEAPRPAEKDGRQTLLVEGHPFLILGGQIHNSSAWPVELPQVWKSMAALNANTAVRFLKRPQPRLPHFVVEGSKVTNSS